MADLRRINRNVRLELASGIIKPAVITAVGAGTTVDLRVGHHGQTHLAVSVFATPGTIGWKWGRGSV